MFALLTQFVRIDPFLGVPASEKDHVMAMQQIEDCPYAIEQDASASGLLWEWAAPKLQKALDELARAMRDG